MLANCYGYSQEFKGKFWNFLFHLDKIVRIEKKTGNVSMLMLDEKSSLAFSFFILKILLK